MSHGYGLLVFVLFATLVADGGRARKEFGDCNGALADPGSSSCLFERLEA